MIKPYISRQNTKIIATAIAYIMPFLATIFIGLVAWRSLKDLPDYQWSIQQLWWLLGAISLYPFSLVVMLFNWRQIIRNLGANVSGLSDIYIYCMNITSKRLPMGLLWSTGGRITLYADVGVKKGIVLSGTFLEVLLHTLSALMVWAGLELAGYGFVRSLQGYFYVSNFGVFLGTAILLVLLTGAYIWRRWQIQFLQIKANADLGLDDIVHWLVRYMLTWFIAGIMLWFVICDIATPPLSFTFFTSVAIWAFTGFLGYILSTFPFIGAGAKEITLALILSQFIPFGQAVLIAIIFRLLLAFSDVIIPFIIVLSIRYVQK